MSDTLALQAAAVINNTAASTALATTTVTKTALAATTGAALIGTTGGITLQAELALLASEATSVQAELDVTQTGAGLNASGTYTAPTGTNYIGAATSISNATVLLDAALKTVSESAGSGGSSGDADVGANYANLPTVFPSYRADFAKTAEVPSSATFTRSTPSSELSPRLLTILAANTPSFSYDFTTETYSGVRLEQASTNLVWGSREPTNAVGVWHGYSSAGSSNSNDYRNGIQDAVLSTTVKTLDGSSYAYNFITNVPDSGTAAAPLNTVSNYFTVAPGPLVVSALLKSSGLNQGYLGYVDGTSTTWYLTGSYAYFNLSTGVITTDPTPYGDDHQAAQPTAASMVYMGDGWWKVSVRVPDITAASVNALLTLGMMSNTGQWQFIPDGVSGMYGDCFQVEQLAYSTSAITTPTMASVTRVADAMTIPLSWIDTVTPSGAIYIKFRIPVQQATTVLSLNDGTASNEIVFSVNSSFQPVMTVTSAGTVTATVTGTDVIAAGVDYVIAASFNTSSFMLTSSGGSSVTVTSGALPTTLTTLNTGTGLTLSKLAGYDKPLTALELTALASY